MYVCLYFKVVKIAKDNRCFFINFTAIPPYVHVRAVVALICLILLMGNLHVKITCETRTFQMGNMV